MNLETLFSRLFELIEGGLDDVLSDYNETKKAEFQKYLKNQIKMSRKVKRTSKKEAEGLKDEENSDDLLPKPSVVLDIKKAA